MRKSQWLIPSWLRLFRILVIVSPVSAPLSLFVDPNFIALFVGFDFFMCVFMIDGFFVLFSGVRVCGFRNLWVFYLIGLGSGCRCFFCLVFLSVNWVRVRSRFRFGNCVLFGCWGT